MKRVLMILGMVICIAVQGYAQSNKRQNAFDKWRQSIHKDFDNFREKIMADYADFVRNPWKAFEESAPVPAPRDDKVPPVVVPVDTVPTPIEDKPVVIEEVITPVVDEDPQPQPVAPVEEVPVVDVKYLDFVFFGTPARVRFDKDHRVRMRGVTPDNIADALIAMSTEEYDNLIVDCLVLRSKHKLSDWAYLQMLKAMSEAACGKGTNEAELLMAYVYIQSGYKMRLAQDGTNLYMLYSSKHQIFNQGSYEVDGDRYYCMKDMPDRLYICGAIFPKEQSLSLYITNAIELSQRSSDTRTIASERYPNVRADVCVNRNLIDFYDTYPTSVLGEDVCTRWAMYANTPIQKEVEAMLYPQLRAAINGKNQLEAVNILLNWVQTGFVYEYDDTVWGHDRAFFAEESLFYPYCDCEDRSILFTRLVRDLVGLDCILVFYPGHLASAVCFTEDVRGDYIQLGSKRFVISDPTYIGANVGMTMPRMDNASAKVILLQANSAH